MGERRRYRLTALLAAAPAPETIRQKAEEVFARPEFDPNPRKPFGLPDFVIQCFQWLGTFFQWLGTLWSASPVLFWVLLIGCISLLVLLLGHIGYTIYKSVTFSGGGAGAARAARLRQSGAHFDAAQQSAAAGDFTEAIRELFLALVYRYDEAGRVSLRKSATNREYLTHLDDRLPVRRELEVFVNTLDDFWYAQRHAERPRYENCLALYHRLAAA